MSTKDNVKSCIDLLECGECEKKGNEISCFRKIAGVLSSEEIKKHGLIRTPKNSQFSPTIYDLSLGKFHYVYEIDDQGKSSRTPVCIGTAVELKKENKIEGEQFVNQSRCTNVTELRIPALGAALIQLEEIVDTYTIAEKENVLITGRFDLKLSLVNRGLVSQQGTQIEPCYCGRLYCFIHNFSSEDIILRRGQKIASVEFSYVSCFCNEDTRRNVCNQLIELNKDRYKQEEYCDAGKGITNVRYFGSRPNIKLPEACGLLSASVKAISEAKKAVLQEEVTEKIKKLVVDEVNPDVKKERAKGRNQIIVAVITGLFLSVAAILTGFFNLIQPMIDNNKEYKSKIESYEKDEQINQNKISDLEKRLNDLENKK